MFSTLALQDIHGEVVERHMQVTAVLGVVAMNPRCTATKVDLRPTSADHVALAQTCHQRERHQIALVLLILRQQCLCLRRSHPPHPALRLPVQLDLWRFLDPPLLVAGLATARRADISSARRTPLPPAPSCPFPVARLLAWARRRRWWQWWWKGPGNVSQRLDWHNRRCSMKWHAQVDQRQ